MDWNTRQPVQALTMGTGPRRREFNYGWRFLVACEAPCGHMLFQGAEGQTFKHELAKDYGTAEAAYLNRPSDRHEVVAIFTIWPRENVTAPTGDPAAIKRHRLRNYTKRDRARP